MKINPIIGTTYRINNINKRKINFCSIKTNPICDVFEKNSNSKILLQDKDKKSIEVDFSERKIQHDFEKIIGENPKNIVIVKDGEDLASIIFSDYYKKDALYIDGLMCQKARNKGYKKTGTELLKIAIKESMKRGYGGKIHVCASYSPPPFVFYYKNNFLPEGRYEKYLELIDYAANENENIENLMPDITSMPMFLDEKGARAVLENRRLYSK